MFRTLPFLLFVLGLLPASPAPAAEPEVLAPSVGAAIFEPIGGRMLARVPVTLGEGVLAEKVRLALVAVSRDGKAQESLVDAFEQPPKLVSDRERQVDEIEFVLRTDKVAYPWIGDYKVTFRARRTDGTPAEEQREVILTYRAFQFRPPQELLIEQSCNISWAFGCGAVSASLTLEVLNPLTPGKQWPDALAVQQRHRGLKDGHPVEGELMAETAVSTQGNDRIRMLPLKVAADFPLGETKGAMLVSSPEMSDLEMGFTFRKREQLWVLMVTVFIGLVAGYLLRTVLQSGIERDQRRASLEALGRQIVQSGVGIPDKTLQAKLDELWNELLATMQSRAAMEDSALPSKVESWNERLKAAVADFEDREAKVAARIAELEQILHSSATMPETVVALIKEEQAALAAVKERHSRRDADGADADLTSLKLRLGRQLAEIAEAWALRLRDALQTVTVGIHPPLPADTSMPDERRVLDGLTQGLLAFDRMKDGRDVEKLQRLRRAVHDAGNLATDELFELRRKLIQTANDVLAGLDGHLVQLRQEALKAALDELQAYRMEEWPRAPDGKKESLCAVLEGVTHELTAAVRAVATPLPKEMTDLLTAGRYVEAAEKAAAAAAQPPMQPTPGAAGAGGPQIAARHATTVVLPAPGEPWAGTGLVTSSARPTPRQAAVLEAIKLSSDATWRRIARSQLVQTLGAGAGLVIAAALIFGDSFVGTPNDYFKLLLWGFTTDVGFNTLIDSFKNKVQA